MIVAVPGAVVDTPVTTPVDMSTLAIDAALEAQVPPDGVQLNDVVRPSHTFGLPVITPGKLYTVTVFVL